MRHAHHLAREPGKPPWAKSPGASRHKARAGQTRQSSPAKQAPRPQRYTTWTFGELPELMEISKGGQTLIGFPALVDVQDAVTIEVFDEPDVAASKTAQACAACLRCRSKTRSSTLRKTSPTCKKWPWPTCRWAPPTS
jgi:ATP-dependent helicase HrpA